MRHCCTTLLPFALSAASFAQLPFEHADQRTAYVTYGRIIPFANDGWMVAGHYCDDSGVLCENFCATYGPGGALLETVSIQNSATGLTPTPDGGAFLCGRSPMCDVLVSTSGVARIEADGSVAWERTYAVHYLERAACAPSGHLALAAEDSVLMLNAAGDSLAYWPSHVGQVSVLRWAGDSVLILGGDDSLARVTPTGELLQGQTTEGVIKDILVSDDGLLVLLSDRIVRMNSELETLDTIDLSDWTLEARALTSDGTTWMVRSSTGMVRFQPDGGVLGAFPFDAPEGYTVAQAAVQNTVVATCGVAAYQGRTSGVIRTHTLDGVPIGHDEDVEVFIAAVDSNWAESNTANVFSLHQFCRLGVVNHGSTTVDGLLLEYLAGSWFCGPAGIAMDTTGLQLAPGDTAILPFPELQTFNTWLDDGDTLDIAFCIVALSPNSIIDRDGSDNETCGSFHFVNNVGMNEIGTDGLRVWPTPFDDHINLSFSAPITTALGARLYDATGRTVASTLVPAGTTSFTWALQPQVEGCYILGLDGDRAPVARRLLHYER